jgi:hypothetical protein
MKSYRQDVFCAGTGIIGLPDSGLTLPRLDTASTLCVTCLFCRQEDGEDYVSLGQVFHKYIAAMSLDNSVAYR